MWFRKGFRKAKEFDKGRKGQRGSVGIWGAVVAIIAVIVIGLGLIVPFMQHAVATSSFDAAIRYLNNFGYTVLGAGDGVQGHLIPTQDDTFDLGSGALTWRDLYLGGDSLHLGNRNLTDTGTQFRIDNIAIPRTATLVVAANDTSAAGKAQADYVCSGTDDDTQIQAAIDALPAGGGKIRLLEGNFMAAVNLRLPSDNIAIEGVGKSTIVGSADCASSLMTVNANVGQPDVTVADSSDFRVGQSVWIGDNLTNEHNITQSIAGNVLTMTVNLANNYTIAQVGYVQSAINVFELTGDYCSVSDLSIDGNIANNPSFSYFLDNYLHAGVQIYGDYCTVQRVKSYNNPTNQINMWQCNYAWTDQCITYTTPKPGASNNVAGIETDQSFHCWITNNYVYNIAGDGIDLDYSDYIFVHNNECYDNLGNGFEVSSANYCQFTHNLSKDNEEHGFDLAILTHSMVEGNTIEDNNSSGIRTTGASQYVTIQGNIIVGAPYGINVDSSGNYFTIVGNLVKNTTTQHGMNIEASDVLISSNECVDNKLAGIIARGERVHIIGNLCYSTDSGDPIAAWGIYTTGTKVVVEGNQCYWHRLANYIDSGTLNQFSPNNIGIDTALIAVYQQVKNTSGGALVTGDVVVFKTVAAGNEITTTVNQGDNMVYGMVAEDIADNATGYVLVEGKTTALKVNGTANIAIGDLLGTHTVAKISRQVAAGDMAFAIALEAYAGADDNGVIDAILIKPRKV